MYRLVLGEKPENEKFQRVHAVLVTRDGRVLLRYKNGEARVTGGRIDPGDKDLVAALKREILEEINCEIDKCDYVGYVEVRKMKGGIEAKEEREYWARMVARVAKILPAKADPDRENQWIYGRKLVPLDEMVQEMAETFPTNRELLPAAIKIAREKNYFDLPKVDKVEVLNPESVGGVEV